MARAPENGQLEAHTLARSGREAAGVDAGGADRGDQAPDQAPDQAMTGADPAALLDGQPMLTRGDLLETVAEMTAAERRGRGRPPGSPNRKNKEMIAYLEARGIRDPWLTLAVIQSADTVKLAEMLGQPALNEEGRPFMVQGKPVMIPADPLKVLQLQKSAAEALMPYHHARQPQQLDLPDMGDARPMMVIGEMNVSIEQALDGFMSAGKVVENQSLGGHGGVRDGEHSSHADANALKDKDNPPSAT